MARESASPPVSLSRVYRSRNGLANSKVPKQGPRPAGAVEGPLVIRGFSRPCPRARVRRKSAGRGRNPAPAMRFVA